MKIEKEESLWVKEKSKRVQMREKTVELIKKQIDNQHQLVWDKSKKRHENALQNLKQQKLKINKNAREKHK